MCSRVDTVAVSRAPANAPGASCWLRRVSGRREVTGAESAMRRGSVPAACTQRKRPCLSHSGEATCYTDDGEIYTVSQKTRHQTIGHNFTNYYPFFQIFFTSRLGSKFATNSCLNIPPLFKHVATLPSEI